jgi:hypothetical protein
MEKMFERASRMKLRFDSAKGQLSVEDLWDLPLQSVTKVNLDSLAVTLNKELKAANSEESFVKPAISTDDTLELRFEIVKYVISVKVAERDAANLARTKAEEKQKLLALLDDKQNEELKNLTADEIRARIAAL